MAYVYVPVISFDLRCESVTCTFAYHLSISDKAG